MSDSSLFEWRHFEDAIILCAVRCYLRYALSDRDVDELIHDHGVSVDHTTVFRRVQHYAPELETRCRTRLKATNDSSRVDETSIKVKQQMISCNRPPKETAMQGFSYDPRANAQRSGYTREGFAARYDAYRPAPPPALLDILCQFIQTHTPALVVDLGSGTGLSTAVWADRSHQVIGLEPLAAMRRAAEARYQFPHVVFRDASAQATGVPDGAADIVTCAQSLHWMEPASTFAEVAPVLRPGGVFAAYDYDLLPTIDWQAEAALAAFMAQIRQLRQAHAVPPGIREWDKAGHLGRLEASGRFRYVKELLLHHTELCTAERWVGFALTLREVAPVLELGLAEAAAALEAFRRAADQTLSHAGQPWYVSYRVRMGVK